MGEPQAINFNVTAEAERELLGGIRSIATGEEHSETFFHVSLDYLLRRSEARIESKDLTQQFEDSL